MVHAFVLVDCAAGTQAAFADEIREHEHVTEAHVIAGDFDAMIEMEADEVRDVLETVTQEVRTVDGIGTTRTYVALE